MLSTSLPQSIMGSTRPASSGTAGTEKQDLPSATVRLQYPVHACPTLDAKLCEELSVYGELARLDTSLGSLLGSILVTYFDVRCSQCLIATLGAAVCSTYPAADHDFRALQLSMATFTEMANTVGGLGQFGEVANIQLLETDVVVEFHDMRSAQLLLSSSGGAAVPWKPTSSKSQLKQQQQIQPIQQLQSIHTVGVTSMCTSPFGKSPLAFSPLPTTPLATSPLKTPSSTYSTPVKSLPTPPGLGGDEDDAVVTSRLLDLGLAEALDFGILTSKASQHLDCEPGSPTSPKGGNKPGRTKVTTKEFLKYDIHPDKISNGEDTRTTIMVRNLAGVNARQDFLKLLERSGLAEKYTFFYMPCKEHRNVPVGFAFVNFNSPHDVLHLNSMVNSGVWRECATDVQPKALAVSYARFQGQDELIKHFSSSAVLREQDPDKRPIFRTSGGDLKQLNPSDGNSPRKSSGRTNARGEGPAQLSLAQALGAKGETADASSGKSPEKGESSDVQKILSDAGASLDDPSSAAFIGA